MNDKTFDPNTLMTATREAFAPVLKARQEAPRRSSVWRACSTPSPATSWSRAWPA